MRVAVFGASGRTGRPLVEQALAAGHEVRALVRDPLKLQTGHVDDLALMASGAGLDPDEARAFLSDEGGTQDVWESRQAAAEFGIGGVPFYIVDGRYAVSGGQPTEVWLRTLDAIEAERVS